MCARRYGRLPFINYTSHISIPSHVWSPMIVYVYHDADHSDIELFKTLREAKKYGDERWPDDEEGWTDEYDGQWSLGEYVSIHKRNVR